MLEQLGPGLAPDVLYIGRRGGVEERIAASLGLTFVGLDVGGLRGLGPVTQVRNLSQLVTASRVAARSIDAFQPNAAFATGGYVSAPVLWAAWRGHVPAVIELPDLEPGWAIRATWRMSKQVAVSFPEVLSYFPPGRATVTGYPVRSEFFQATRAVGLAHFGLDPNSPVVTVFGGSQGAHILNEAVAANLEAFLNLAQVIHLTGPRDLPQMEAARAQLAPALAARVRVFDYLKDDMPLALAAADVVVARAGAATLGEFPAVGVPAVLVPGEFAQGHQARNAEFLAARGAAVILREDRLQAEWMPTLRGLLDTPERLEAMRRAVKALAQPQAARRIADLVVGVAR